jgi:hydroxymethylglutaryl-CoA lyase
VSLTWPESVSICEVGPRDGFQMEAAFIPTDVKVEIIDALARTGLRRIQASSFVHPRAIPQLADAEQVFARIARVPGVTYTALVPNERGAERAVAAGADGLDAVVSVTDSHALSNTRMTTAEAMERLGRVAAIARAAGKPVSVGFATALGCPFEGFPPYERLESLVARAVEDYGIGEVGIADTVGMASPARVAATMGRLLARFPAVRFSLHLHDTRGMGLANLVAGLLVGVRSFDAALAGLGGCPYAPGASGNIATEDAVHMLAEMGVRTGVDLDALLRVAARVREVVGHAESHLLRAGPSRPLGPYRPS